ncbi:hypothetical protein G7Y89_g13938 [Cudoniella acicularis]|uniref:Uncharacterized protein n=1 Tax=Cudoniella acicularis TaxID=354080 RepID=A0A8H4R8Q5_9HELO|nr:hypothetical protein G7Y89_g13938 [Cudoniella acicularis]
MGRGHRHRNRGQNEESFVPNHNGRYYQSQNRNRPLNGPRLGPYDVGSRPPFHSFNRQHSQRQTSPPHSTCSPSPNHQSSELVPAFDYNAFILNSKKLKNFLVASLHQSLTRIQQGYPEDAESDEEGFGDEMDWKPEIEVLIPVPDAGVGFAWGHLIPEVAAYEPRLGFGWRG